MPRIIIPGPFKKVLSKKPVQMRAAVSACIKRLEENPRHPSLQAHRMQGRKGVWEAYVDKANRVTFHYNDRGDIVLRMNCNHDMLYRNP